MTFLEPDWWTAFRWANVALSSTAVVLMIVGSFRHWDVLTLRVKRIIPWVVMTYVVIAYGSGELATTDPPVPPGIRVMMAFLTLTGLVVALLFAGHGADDE